VLRSEVADETNGRCMYCGIDLEWNFPIDHFQANSRGGENSIENYVPSCKPCNGSKGNRSLEEWRVSLANARYRDEVGMPYFSKEQRTYLAAIGVDLYANAVLPVFWFEREGANLNAIFEDAA